VADGIFHSFFDPKTAILNESRRDVCECTESTDPFQKDMLAFVHLRTSSKESASLWHTLEVRNTLSGMGHFSACCFHYSKWGALYKFVCSKGNH
jgi:hypothetical protein